MTFDFFTEQMDRLRGLKFPPTNLQTHWEALKDMPEILFAAAVTKAQPECDEFPSPKMLKVYADQLRVRVLGLEEEADRSIPAPDLPPVVIPGTTKVIPITRYWNYYCEACSDLGWRSYVCGAQTRSVEVKGEWQDFPRQEWLERRHCGRRQDHAAHSWSEPCSCAEHNPDVQRRRNRDAATPPRGTTA